MARYKVLLTHRFHDFQRTDVVRMTEKKITGSSFVDVPGVEPLQNYGSLLGALQIRRQYVQQNVTGRKAVVP